jgi:hypothetical protein
MFSLILKNDLEFVWLKNQYLSKKFCFRCQFFNFVKNLYEVSWFQFDQMNIIYKNMLMLFFLWIISDETKIKFKMK